MESTFVWKTHLKDGPLIATAIHDGDGLRPEVAALIAVDRKTRKLEEDPFTSELADIGFTRIIGLRSRFEVDLNRPREKAVYINPEDAWGIKVWNSPPAEEIIARSIDEYDSFYNEMYRILTRLKKKYGYFVVLDLHSYNYMRKGPGQLPEEPELNPEVNIGTGTIDRGFWNSLIHRFITDMKSFPYEGRFLDVRENIKFKGGNFSRWIHENFPDSGCSISVEFKKIFMDEWTGVPDLKKIDQLRSALQSTVPGVLKELERIGMRS